MPDVNKDLNQHANADVDKDRLPSDDNMHLPFAANASVGGNQVFKDEDGKVTWFPGKIPAALNLVDGEIVPSTENDGDIYVLLQGTELDVDTILFQSGNTIRYNFGGTPDLSAFAALDFLFVENAGKASNNGNFVISAVDDGADFIEITNPNRSDATDDEAAPSPAIAHVTLAEWDGAKPNSWNKFDLTADLWSTVDAQLSNDFYNKTTNTNWFFNGTVWVEETLSTDGLLDFLGDFSASGDPNYPVANKGDTFFISVAGRVGGASGKVVAIGDILFAKNDNGGGTEAAVGTDWAVIEMNLDLINGLLLGAAGSPAASALLEMQSTTKGFLPPRMTTVQRLAIAAPATGLVVYDTDIDALFVFLGPLGWAQLQTDGGAAIGRDSLTIVVLSLGPFASFTSFGSTHTGFNFPDGVTTILDGVVGPLPTNLDTAVSTEIIVALAAPTDSTATGNIRIEALIGYVADQDSLLDSAAHDSTVLQTKAVPATAALSTGYITATFDMGTTGLVAGKQAWVAFRRLGADAADTYTANVVLMGWQLTFQRTDA